MTPTQNPLALEVCLSRGAWKAGMPGSEGAGTQQCVPATRRHHIRRMRKRGTNKHYVYTKPSNRAIQAIKDKVRARTNRSTRHQDLDQLLASLNRILTGWARYFRYGVSKATFNAADSYTWGRIMRWIRAKYAGRKRRLGMSEMRRRFCDKGCRFAHNGVAFTGAFSIPVTRYRYGGSTIATPWSPKPAAASNR